ASQADVPFPAAAAVDGAAGTPFAVPVPAALTARFAAVLGLRPRPARGPKEALQFPHKAVQIPKLPIHGGKAHVRHFVQFPQAIHDPFADAAGRDLRLAPMAKLPLDGLRDVLQLLRGNGPLLTRLQQAGQHLLPGKSLPPPVFLNDDEGAFLPPLVGGEPAAAHLALPPAAHRGALIHRAGFEHLGVSTPAVRTSHRAIPLPGKPPSKPLYHAAYVIV